MLDEELEVLELEPDPIGSEAEELLEEDMAAPVAAMVEEEEFSPLAMALVFGTTLVLLLTLPILISLGKGNASSIAKSIGGVFVVFDEPPTASVATGNEDAATDAVADDVPEDTAEEDSAEEDTTPEGGAPEDDSAEEEQE